MMHEFGKKDIRGVAAAKDTGSAPAAHEFQHGTKLDSAKPGSVVAHSLAIAE
jgi:hypothetical protein